MGRSELFLTTERVRQLTLLVLSLEPRHEVVDDSIAKALSTKLCIAGSNFGFEDTLLNHET